MRRGRLPLTALRSFEAAGRLESFSAAARELHVSQAAISRQVRELETWLGAKLFTRLHRRVELTADGGRLLTRLTASFDDIEREVGAIRRVPERRTLVVSVDPAFAALWLAARLRDFQAREPLIDIEIEADMELVDFRSHRVELAVRYGATGAPWPGTAREALVDCWLGPVLSPSLAAAGPPVTTPADLARHVLLHEESRDEWARWFEAAGAPQAGLAPGPLFNDVALAVHTAARGHGVALADRLLARDEIVAGRLIRPFAVEIPMGGYWLVTSDRRAPSAPAERFSAWLRERISAARSEAAARDHH